MPTATSSASIIPWRPPRSEPIAMKSAVIAAIRTAVFRRLNMRFLPFGSSLEDGGPQPASKGRGDGEARAGEHVATLKEFGRADAPPAGPLELGERERAASAGHLDAVGSGLQDRSRRAATVRHAPAPALDDRGVDRGRAARKWIEGTQ